IRILDGDPQRAEMKVLLLRQPKPQPLEHPVEEEDEGPTFLHGAEVEVRKICRPEVTDLIEEGGDRVRCRSPAHPVRIARQRPTSASSLLYLAKPLPSIS